MATVAMRFTGNGSIAVNGVLLPVRTETATYAAALADQIVLANGTFTISLPAAADCVEDARSDSFDLFNIGTGVITIDPNASETINGGATLVLNKQYTGVRIYTNGSNWFATAIALNVPQASEADPAALTSATLTDSSGGSANTTVQAIGSSFSQSEIANNFADVTAQANALRVDLGAVRTSLINVITKLENAGVLTPV